MGAKSGVVGAFYIQAATVNTFTTEACTLQTDKRTLKINDTTKIMFKNDITLFTVYKDAIAMNVPFEIEIDCIVFADEQDDTATYTLSGTYSDLTQKGGFFEWSLDVKNKINDVTDFASAGFEKKISGVKSFTASAKRYFVDDDFVDQMDGTLVITRFFTDIDSFESFVGYTHITGEKIGQKVSGIAESEISFDGHGKLIYCNIEL